MRALGIARVSSYHDGISPDVQEARIGEVCAREGFRLREVLRELDVSGRRPLAKRPGLLQAVELVEAGAVDVIVVAYFDRLVRSLKVQAEVLERVQAAGGKVLALDFGEVSTETATQWLSSTMVGMMSEYFARSAGERTAAARAAAVMKGIPTVGRVPPGLVRVGTGDERRLELDPATAPAVRAAFRLRADGATYKQVRVFLAEHGLDVALTRVQSMFKTRLYLGELSAGEVVNVGAHEALIDEATWRRAQMVKGNAGRPASEQRLLARLDVLHCASCGARLVLSHAKNGRSRKRYPQYRCPSHVRDCTNAVSISAPQVEEHVAAETQRLLRRYQGRASLANEIEHVRGEVDAAQHDFDSAVEAFDGMDDAQSVKAKLAGLRATLDAANSRYAELLSTAAPALTVSIDDWHLMTLDEQRRFVQFAIESVLVSPGRVPLADRVTIQPRESFAQQAESDGV